LAERADPEESAVLAASEELVVLAEWEGLADPAELEVRVDPEGLAVLAEPETLAVPEELEVRVDPEGLAVLAESEELAVLAEPEALAVLAELAERADPEELAVLVERVERGARIGLATAAPNRVHPEGRPLAVEAAAVLVEDQHGPAVREGPRAWEEAAAEGQAVEGQAAADAGDKCIVNRRHFMKTKSEVKYLSLQHRLSGIFACVCLAALVLHATPQSAPASKPKKFDTAQQAADALIAATQNYDVEALKVILGSDSNDILVSEDPVSDKNIGLEFGAKAKEKTTLVPDPKDPGYVTMNVGADDWPLPIPIVQTGKKWSFDTAAGRDEILLRRIGRNELDVVEICHGYVEAQVLYALQKHDGATVNQYAQRVLSTPGKHDGLAWQNPDGTWGGPVGDGVARAIEQGYSDKTEPYHGYFFKILKGQGPAAPLGEMDFMVKGAMIGGFALVAVPAQYKVTGVMTFMVGSNGVVYQKDNGKNSLDLFKKMERFNPDKTWTPVVEGASF